MNKNPKKWPAHRAPLNWVEISRQNMNNDDLYTRETIFVIVILRHKLDYYRVFHARVFKNGLKNRAESSICSVGGCVGICRLVQQLISVCKCPIFCGFVIQITIFNCKSAETKISVCNLLPVQFARVSQPIEQGGDASGGFDG